jgi:hypothetical protein
MYCRLESVKVNTTSIQLATLTTAAADTAVAAASAAIALCYFEALLLLLHAAARGSCLFANAELKKNRLRSDCERARV